MNFIYMCRDGDNEELRYSIRSLYKHTIDPKVWIVGGKPSWYNGNHLFVPQNDSKYQNVRKNISTFVQSEDIPEDIVLMNDDFFIMKDLEEIPIIHGGFLKDKIAKYNRIVKNSKYTNILIQTNEELQRLGVLNPIDYDMHVPMPMKKSQIKIYQEFAMRTMYGNINDIGGKQIKDVKVYDLEAINRGAESYDYSFNDLFFLSSNDKSFRELYVSFLKESFNTKSPLEK